MGWAQRRISADGQEYNLFNHPLAGFDVSSDSSLGPPVDAGLRRVIYIILISCRLLPIVWHR